MKEMNQQLRVRSEANEQIRKPVNSFRQDERLNGGRREWIAIKQRPVPRCGTATNYVSGGSIYWWGLAPLRVAAKLRISLLTFALFDRLGVHDRETLSDNKLVAPGDAQL